jgi:hypothetical protein
MLVLVREDSGTKISWWWNSETSTYSRRVNGQHIHLTSLEYVADIVHRFPNSRHCDGMEKWAEAGRPN